MRPDPLTPLRRSACWPSTPRRAQKQIPSGDKQYRLFSQKVFSFCAGGGKIYGLKVKPLATDSGKEGPFQAPILKVNGDTYLSADQSEIDFSWTVSGTPNIVVEPAFWLVFPRTTRAISHTVSGKITVMGSDPKVDAQITGTIPKPPSFLQPGSKWSVLNRSYRRNRSARTTQRIVGFTTEAMRSCCCALLAVFVLVSCKPKSEQEAITQMKTGAEELEAAYQAALESGKRDNPLIRDFDTQFEHPVDSISYYVGGGRPEWMSKVALFRRYVISMRIPVTLSPDKTQIIGFGSPAFQIVEIEGIGQDGSIRYSGKQLDFGLKEWQFLREHNMDFSILGYPLIRDKPVNRFAEHWQQA